jgi:putative tRNA adenosine deaminase-associated protein
VSYFAAAVVGSPMGWTASLLDLNGVADIEEVADRLRDVDPDAAVSLLFVESDDAYLVILRLDEGEDLRVFGSDAAFADESRLGALLLGEIEEPALEIEEVTLDSEADLPDDDDDDVAPAVVEAPADVEPVGDADLLADLGIPADRLLKICSHGGMLPADVTTEVCQLLGCGDEVEELREG